MVEKKASLGTVTVVMPVYNCEMYIENAILSVLAQTYTHWRLIVINDGSTDSSCSIVQKIASTDKRVTLVHNTSVKGAAGARNCGLDMCVGEFVAFLDSDDVWEPDKLETQLMEMNRKNADMSYTSYSIVDENGKSRKKTYVVPESTSFEQMLKENVVGCSTVVFTNELARKYRFATDYYHEDYCMWLDILRDGYKVIGCPEPLVKWRLISNSRSFNKKNSAKNRWEIYRHYLKLPLSVSVKAFLMYAINGIKKYFG